MRISLLITLIPLFFQLVFGSLSIAKKVVYDFRMISVISLGLQLFLSFMGIKIISNELQAQNVKCGLPLASYFFACVFLLIVLVVVILIQMIIKKRRSL
jgi:archaellum biogenesis protein FlaJ (TadC family)